MEKNSEAGKNFDKYKYDSKYSFDISKMDNEDYIQERINQSGLQKTKDKKTFERILRFLYISDYKEKVTRKTLQNYQKYLVHSAEILAGYRLATRCTGALRFKYGIHSVLAIKRDKYKCIVCGESDIRCIEIDHTNGKKGEKSDKSQVYTIDDFQTLCANHHRIKTVVENQQN